MKSWIISIIALFMGVCSVQAKNVPVEKAMNAAEAYCRQSGTVSTRSAGINGVGSTLQLAYTAKPEGVSLRSSSGSSDACFYIFNLGNGGGFIIVSADDRACPVLGYSNEGAFDLSTAPPAFMEYLANYQNEITALLKDNPDIAPDPAWQRLETGSPLQGISTRAAQLLATASWGQSWPYNTQCPEYNGQQTITGCVATAMAIVMKYHADHGYAARGTGSHSYSWQGQTLSATFGTYDYQNMPLTSTEYTNNQTKIDAVAKLMFHCGVSVDATYGAGGTSANQTKIAPALKNYFGFDARCELIKKSDYSTDAWKSFIKKEIDLNQPILYYCSGSGAHMFICDGYNDDDKFHFNWGQSGGYNGWFELTATIQPGYGSTYFFDNSQMVIGIKKAEISVAEVAQLSLVSLKSGKGMAKNVETVVQNQTFTVTASTVANMSTTNFDGVIAVALYDAAGNRKEILERKAINLTVQGSLEQYAPSLSFSNCKVTTTISPTDILRLIASADGGNTWKLVLDGGVIPDYLPVVAKSSDATLSSLTVSAGTLSPVFASNTTSYTVNVANNVTSLTIGATVTNAAATVTGTGAKTLNVGNNNFAITVTAQDGTTKQYTVTVVRAMSDDATLSGLSVSQGALTPAFSATVTAYSVSVPNNVTTIAITATRHDPAATVTGDGSKTLNVGANTFNIIVTAQNGTTKTYTITVTRAKSSDATLSTLTVSSGSLSPAFASTTTSYTVNVANSVTSLTLSATATHAAATVSGTGAKTLNVGDNTFNIVVTAEDGTTTMTYTVTVHRVSNDATLSSLTVSAGTLSPVFSSTTTSYTVNVANSVTSLTLSATATYTAATVSGTGSKTLNTGSNSFSITVTAEDGSTTQTYAITVVRAYSNDAALSGLSVTSGALSPAFNAGTTSYTVNVVNSVSSVTISATAHHPSATLTGTGAKTLNTGSNTFNITVTAEDGTTTQTYTITVNRMSNDATLSALSVSSGTLSPAFASGTTSYSATVVNVSSLAITATANHTAATVTGAGTKTLNVGSNSFTITVTSEDGTNTQTYTVAITSYSCTSGISGTDGDLTWVLCDSTLTISGNGVMPNYSIISIYPHSPWDNYKNNIREVFIENGITSIGDWAFYGCTSLTSITIPSGVTSIGEGTFSGCTGLTSITIPSSVTSIMGGAFSFCTGLTSITIPSSVTSIENQAFSNSGLISINIPSSVTSIGDYAFYVCTGLTSITIPSSVTSIGHGAFCGCVGLPSITIPSSVTSIGGGAFSYCTGLTSITIPNSVTSIGDGAFGNCLGLTSITIPNSVTSIGDGAFQYCAGLTSITIPSSVTSIGVQTFYGCHSLTSVTIPGSVTSIGIGAFSWCTGLTSIRSANSTPPTAGTDCFLNVDKSLCTLFVPSGSGSAYQAATGWSDFFNIVELACMSGTTGVLSWSLCDGKLTLSGSGAMPDYSLISASPLTINRPWDNYKNNILEVEIQNGVTSIGDYAFDSCKYLTSVTIPSSVTSIGKYAFFNCWSLYTVTIPESVTSIDEGVFYGCWHLESVIIPNSLTSIGKYAFSGCSSLWYLATPSFLWGTFAYNYEDIWDYHYLDGLGWMTIPKNVTSIGDSAFAGCGLMTNVINYSSTPQQLTNGVFDGVNLTTAILEVPVGAEAAYKTANVWKDFGFIKEEDSYRRINWNDGPWMSLHPELNYSDEPIYLQFQDVHHQALKLFENDGSDHTTGGGYEYNLNLITGDLFKDRFGKTINFLGVKNIYDFPEETSSNPNGTNYSFYIDTAYVNRDMAYFNGVNISRTKPQYLIAKDVQIFQNCLCVLPPYHSSYTIGRYMYNTAMYAKKVIENPVNYDLAQPIAVSFFNTEPAIYGTSVEKLAYSGRNYCERSNYWERIAFAWAIHYGDSLYVLNNIEPSLNTTNNPEALHDKLLSDGYFNSSSMTTIDFSKLIAANHAIPASGQIGVQAIINLADNTHKDWVWSFRYIERGSDIFIIESETSDRDRINGPVSNPSYGGWITYQNHIPTIVRDNMPRDLLGEGQLMNVNLTDDVTPRSATDIGKKPEIISTTTVEVRTSGNKLLVISPFDEYITVYSLSGNVIYTAHKVAGTATFTTAIPRGIYIVRGANGWARKIIIN